MIEDLYDDLEEPDITEELYKTRTKNQTLEDENTQLKEVLSGSTEKCGTLETENEQLKINISILLKTAQGEIKRKDNIINELRTELDNLKFRHLGSQNKLLAHPNPNRCNPQLYPKIDSDVKPQQIINELPNQSIIETKKEQQTPPVSGYNESRQSNSFTSKYDFEDPRLHRILNKNDPDKNILTSGMIDVKWHLRPVSPSPPCREERTGELQPESLYGKIVPKLENELITGLLPNNDTVKTDDLDILELDTKQEFGNDKEIPEIRKNSDRKRKRYSQSPIRKILKRSTPDSDHRKNSPDKNRHRLVSKSSSRENNTSQERQSRSPHSARRFSRESDRLIGNTLYGSYKQDQNSRNRESSRSRNKRNNEFRHSDNRRRNYEESDQRRERHGFVNDDNRKKVDKYSRRSPLQRRETYKDHRNKMKSSNFNSSDRFSSEVCSKDSNKNENKLLSDKTGSCSERRKDKFSEQSLSFNKFVNHDSLNDRNAHFRKKNHSAKDETHGKPFEPLKHILNLYNDSEKDAKHRDYNKNTDRKEVSSKLKKKSLSLDEYSKRRNSVIKSGDITDTEIKKGSTTKVYSNPGCVELKNTCKDGRSDQLNEYVDTEDGELLSDLETDLQNLEERIEHQSQGPELHHIVTTSNSVLLESMPKKYSLSESQPVAEINADTCLNLSKLAEINESKRSVNYSFSNRPRETKARHIPLQSKLPSDVASDSCASFKNNDDCLKKYDSNNIEEYKQHDKEDTVTNIPSATSADQNTPKYIHKKKYAPKTALINSQTDVEPSKSSVSVSSINCEEKTILQENATIEKYKITEYKNKKHNIDRSAVKHDKSLNSIKLSKKLNTTNPSLGIHFNEIPTKTKSKPIHNVSDRNSYATSNVIRTQHEDNKSIYQFVTMDKAVDNYDHDEQTASTCKSPKEKSQNTLFDVIKSSSKISRGVFLKAGGTSQTVLRNSQVSDSLNDSCMNYSKINSADKYNSNVPKNLPFIEDACENSSFQRYNNAVDNSPMNHLMKISQTNFTHIHVSDSKVPKVIPIVKDSREIIPTEKKEISDTVVYESIMKEYTKTTHKNSPGTDVLKVISDKSKKRHNAVYDTLVDIMDLSQNNTNENKMLGDSLIKDDVETCQTISTGIVESFNMKEKDLDDNNLMNSFQATSANIECDGKLLNNPPISDEIDVSSKIFTDCLSGNTPVTNKQIILNECQTIKSNDILGTKILENASNKDVELVSKVIPINLIHHIEGILDYSYTKEKSITADCNKASNKILGNVYVADKVNIALSVTTNIDGSENKTFLNSINGNDMNSVHSNKLPIEKTIDSHDTDVNKTVAKVETPKISTTNSNTVHFKIARRRNVAIKSSLRK